MSFTDLIKFADLRHNLSTDDNGIEDDARLKDIDELLAITDNLAHQRGYADCAYDLSVLKKNWEENKKGGKK